MKAHLVYPVYQTGYAERHNFLDRLIHWLSLVLLNNWGHRGGLGGILSDLVKHKNELLLYVCETACDIIYSSCSDYCAEIRAYHVY